MANTCIPEEVQSLVRSFADPAPIQSSEIHISDERYMAIKADYRSIYGKMVRVSNCVIPCERVRGNLLWCIAQRLCWRGKLAQMFRSIFHS